MVEEESRGRRGDRSRVNAHFRDRIQSFRRAVRAARAGDGGSAGQRQCERPPVDGSRSILNHPLSSSWPNRISTTCERRCARSDGTERPARGDRPREAVRRNRPSPRRRGDPRARATRRTHQEPSVHHPFRSALMRIQRVTTVGELGNVVVKMRRVTGTTASCFIGSTRMGAVRSMRRQRGRSWRACSSACATQRPTSRRRHAGCTAELAAFIFDAARGPRA